MVYRFDEIEMVETYFSNQFSYSMQWRSKGSIIAIINVFAFSIS